MLEKGTAAAIPDKEKVLLAFIERVNASSFALRLDEILEVREAGWSEEAIYDAVSVCALFNFYNRWCDACGVQPMAPEDHAASGQRMAKFGYLPPNS